MKVKYFDYLRVVSIFAVVLLHSVSHYTDQFGQILFSDWINVTVVNSFLRFCVPVFFMISGALNLDSEKPFVMKKRVMKILIPLLAWSFVYMLFSYYLSPETFSLTAFSPFKEQVFFHLWFVYLLAGLYLMTPFIRKLVETSSLTKYFLILWVIWSVILPTLNIFFDAIPYLNLDLYAGFIGWYVLGYYLHKHFNRNIHWFLLFIGYLFASVAIFIGTYILTVSTLQNNHDFYSNLNLFVVIQAVCVFLFFKNQEESLKSSKIIQILSDVSFSLYFAHALVLQLLYNYQFNEDILLNALNYFVITVIGLSLVLSIIKLLGINQKYIEYIQLTVVTFIIILFASIGEYKFFIPKFDFNFKSLTWSYANLNKADNLYLSEVEKPREKMLDAFNLNIHNQQGIIRIALPTHIIESYAPNRACALYVPDNQSVKDGLKHTKFSKAPQLGNYNVSAEDVFSQLICKDSEKIELRFNKLDKIYLFYY
jgi:surface polysaccharide O-acyltransferase-like enzyme